MMFSLCYASRRPQKIKAVVDLWRQRCSPEDAVEVVLAVDADDPKSKLAGERTPHVKVFVQHDKPFNCVKAWNLAASQATGKIIIAIADDFIPPHGWSRLIKDLKPGWEDNDHVVHVNDGYVQTICTLAILSRVRYQKFGYLFNPGYSSLFCDTEFTERAYHDGVVLDAKHLLFEHMHPDCRKRERDNVDLMHASQARWNAGEALFQERKVMGFPTEVETTLLSAPKRGHEFAAYLQVTRDDFCLYPVCQRLVEVGVKAFFFCVPDHYWSGRKTTPEEVAQVDAICQRLRYAGVNAQLRMFDVQSHVTPGKLRVSVETEVRNESLAWIRSCGYEHILVVDGDEVWHRHLLDLVDSTLNCIQPLNLVCRMVPVVGLPGYPIISSENDFITIYMGKDELFGQCRTPRHAIPRTVIDFHGVFHFTATRKDMDEIIKKTRESGHYDDPAYRMEDWIKYTLPNIHVGMKNVHMYAHFQIWKEVRGWYPGELDEIPRELHQYVGTVTSEPQHPAKTPGSERHPNTDLPTQMAGIPKPAPKPTISNLDFNPSSYRTL